MQYRSTNATLESGCVRQCNILFTIQLNGALACFFLLSCSPNYAICADTRIYCQYNKSLHRATRINIVNL